MTRRCGLVRYLGSQFAEARLPVVSFSDRREEVAASAKVFKKKLGLTASDAELDQAILAVGRKLKGDRSKNRVTVYYLFADHFGKLSTFRRRQF